MCGQICTKLHKKVLKLLLKCQTNLSISLFFSSDQLSVKLKDLGPCIVLISPRGRHWFLHHPTQSSCLAKSVSQLKINPWQTILPAWLPELTAISPRTRWWSCHDWRWMVGRCWPIWRRHDWNVTRCGRLCYSQSTLLLGCSSWFWFIPDVWNSRTTQML